MYRRPARYYKVVCGGGIQLSVWHAEAETGGRWTETDLFGSENECWDFVEAQENQFGYLFRTCPDLSLAS